MNESGLFEVRSAQSAQDMQILYNIREVVFIDEQKVPRHLEIENEAANYYIVSSEGRDLGTGRWRAVGNAYKIERMAVLEEARGSGAGTALLKYMLENIPRDKNIYLNAQLPALKFYERCGFVKEGEIFYEADIAHYKMTWKEGLEE